MDVNDLLTSLQDAISCLEERVRKGWPTDDEKAQVQAELSELDERLWSLCEVK